MWRRKGTLITAWKLYRLCVWFIFFFTGWQAPPSLPMFMTSLRKFRCLVLIATASEPTKLSSPCSSNVRNYFCGQYGIWRTPQISIPIFILHLWVIKSVIICIVDNVVFEKEYLHISFKTIIFCRLPDVYFYLFTFYVHFKVTTEPKRRKTTLSLLCPTLEQRQRTDRNLHSQALGVYSSQSVFSGNPPHVVCIWSYKVQVLEKTQLFSQWNDLLFCGKKGGVSLTTITPAMLCWNSNHPPHPTPTSHTWELASKNTLGLGVGEELKYNHLGSWLNSSCKCLWFSVHNWIWV